MDLAGGGNGRLMSVECRRRQEVNFNPERGAAVGVTFTDLLRKTMHCLATVYEGLHCLNAYVLERYANIYVQETICPGNVHF